MILWRGAALSAATEFTGDPIMRADKNTNDHIESSVVIFKGVFIIPSLQEAC